MLITINYIKDAGDINNERIVMKAIQTGDIGNYICAISLLKDNNNISSKIQYPYWFPDKIITEGATIVLYTKVGRSSERVNEDGSTSYFFYRGESSPIITPQSCAIIIEIAAWKQNHEFRN